MSSWPTGIEAIRQLLAAGNLQRVAPWVAITQYRKQSPRSLRSHHLQQPSDRLADYDELATRSSTTTHDPSICVESVHQQVEQATSLLTTGRSPVGPGCRWALLSTSSVRRSDRMFEAEYQRMA